MEVEQVVKIRKSMLAAGLSENDVTSYLKFKEEWDKPLSSSEQAVEDRCQRYVARYGHINRKTVNKFCIEGGLDPLPEI